MAGVSLALINFCLVKWFALFEQYCGKCFVLGVERERGEEGQPEYSVVLSSTEVLLFMLCMVKDILRVKSLLLVFYLAFPCLAGAG